MNILLVENSKVLAERLSKAICRVEGLNLVATADTETAAIAIVNHQPVDLIILDLHLKEGTGFGVLRAMANFPNKPNVLVLTNYDLPEYKQAALALGATHFLDKARDYARLPELLREFKTNGGRAMSGTSV